MKRKRSWMRSLVALGLVVGMLATDLSVLGRPRDLCAQDTAANPKLAAAKEHYRRARFDTAIALLVPLSEDMTLSTAERLEALEYLAFARANSGDEPGAKDAFRKALGHDASWHPDPLLATPRHQELFAVAQSEFEADRAAALAARTDSPSPGDKEDDGGRPLWHYLVGGGLIVVGIAAIAGGGGGDDDVGTVAGDLAEPPRPPGR